MKTKRAWFWHWQNLQPNAPWWKYGRAWVHFPRNTIRVEWLTGTRAFGAAASVQFSSTLDDSFKLHIAIPWLLSLFISVTGWRWVARLPDVAYRGWGTGRRELSLAIHDSALWVTLWDDPDTYPRRGFTLHFDDFFLGRAKYSERLIDAGVTGVTLPEGTYRATYELFVSEWKRPRWPWAKRMRRGKISVNGGVPVPDKADSDFYEYDEDAILDAIIGDVETVDALVVGFREFVERDRQRHGGPDWKPSRGPRIDPNWPLHFDCKCSLED